MNIEQSTRFAIPEHEGILRGVYSDVQQVSLVEKKSTNAIYVSEAEVFRIARTPESGSLAYEASIAQVIPLETGYPGVTDAGTSDGFAWMRMPRVKGVQLAET